MTHEFFIAMVPPTTTHQEHKVSTVNGKPVFYDPPELKAARQKFMGHLAKHKPNIMFDGVPLRLIVKWCFPRERHEDGEWRITKPDTDNLQKLLKDCMTRCGFWKDDCLICSEVVEKFWADVPGIWIHIETL